MDITPQVINDVEFHQKMRGYDPDEVDDFLERLAVAVGQMQERLREAASRVMGAERRLAELEAQLDGAPARGEGEAPPAARSASVDVDADAETARRTLVLAQRTADAAVQEAQEQAARIVRDAEDKAAHSRIEAEAKVRSLIEDAEAKCLQLLTDADAEARRSGEETRQRLVAEIIELEEARDALRADNGILERHLDEQRLRLRSSVAELQRLLDDPARLREASMPPLSEVSRPPAAAEAVPVLPESEERGVDDDTLDAPIFPGAAQAFPGVEQVLPADAETELDDDELEVAALDEVTVPDDDADLEPIIDLARSEPVTGGVSFTAADDSGELPGFPATTATEDAAWARFVGDDGPPTQALHLDDADEDAYLTELRKAMVDEHGDADLDFADRPRSRFSRRR